MIPVSEPSLAGAELEYVTECIRSGWISSGGPFVSRLEEGFAAYCGRRHGVAVTNGTSALIAAVAALDLPAGGSVVMPSFTIVSPALACVYNDLEPVFVDSDPETWNMDPDAVAAAVSENTVAILVVHTYGHPADMDRLGAIAEDAGVPIVEDFAEAIGSEHGGRRCGSFGAVSCTSFYANKVITTGEGGMCLTDSDRVAERLRAVRNLCFGSTDRFLHTGLGHNFRMTNLQAAVGVAQLERIDELVDRRRRVAAWYLERLAPLQSAGVICLPVERDTARNTYWMFGIVLGDRAGVEVRTLASRLAERGIQTRPFFHPLHDQPAFRGFPWYRPGRLPTAERLGRRGLYLPTGATLEEDTVAMIAATLGEELDAVRQ